MARKTEQQKNVNLDEAITRTGYGFFHILVLLATGGCLMCSIIETMCMMFIIPAAQCDLNLGLGEKGLLSSISFIGVVVSSYMWGYLADTKGRKNVLVVSLGLSFLTTLICSLVPWDWLFILLRFVNGFCCGGAASVVYAYVGEFHDNHYRPKVISWMSAFVAVGNMYLPGLAWLILSQEWSYDLPLLSISFRSWRLLLIVYTIPSFVCALCLYYLPESPKYLLTQGKQKEAIEVLAKMYAINNGKETDSYGVESITWDKLEGSEGKKKDGMLKTMWKQTAPLFKKNLLIKTVMMSFLQFGVFASNSGIIMWYPEILNRMSHYISDHDNGDVALCTAVLEQTDHDNSTQTSCQDTVKSDVFVVYLIIGVAYAIAYILIGCTINKIGKKKLMVGFMAVTAAAGISSQYVYGYALIQFLIGTFLMGGAGIGIANAIAVDLFPTQVRGMAVAVSLMFGRIGAMTGTNVVGPLIYGFCDYLFFFILAVQILIVLVVVMLPTTQPLPKLS